MLGRLAGGEACHLGLGAVGPRRLWARGLPRGGLRLGSLAAKPVIFGIPVSLVGVGALATVVIVTVFYMLMVDVWRLRFSKRLGWAGWVLLAAGVVRLAAMTFPHNRWDQIVAPCAWSLARNFLLTCRGWA